MNGLICSIRARNSTYHESLVELKTPSTPDVFSHTGISRNLLDEIVDAVKRNAKPQKIVLFGSRARGEWEERSDIDIAVYTAGDSLLPCVAIDEEIRTLLKVDIVDFHHLSDSFQQEVLQNGIVLYEAA